MNIFVLDEDPDLAAEYQCDKHVVKMCLETAQLLSTAISVQMPEAENFYKMTHVNHPCSIWARSGFSSFAWLYLHGMALCKEYTKRYHKVHASEKIIKEAGKYVPIFKFSMEFTPFVQAMPEKYRGKNAVIAYRNYYLGDKRHIAEWNYSPIPFWWR